MKGVGIYALALAALPLIGVVIGGCLQYFAGQRLEARKQMHLQQAQAYSDFFRAMAEVAQAKSKDKLALAADAKVRICLYGSDEVVKTLHSFNEAGATAATTAGRSAILDLMIAMRADVTGRDTTFKPDALARIIFSNGAP